MKADFKTKKPEGIETYIKTENEYWNEFALKMLCKVIETGQFENPETPLRLLDSSVDLFTEQSERPVKAVDLFKKSMASEGLNPAQTLFIYDYVCRYLNESDFPGIDIMPNVYLLESEIEKLKADTNPAKLLTKNIRETLKEVMQNEIEKLPETLKGLEPAERLNVLCKLMPFIFPKVDKVHATFNEPSEKHSGW